MTKARMVRRLVALLAAGVALAAAGEITPLSYDDFKKEVRPRGCSSLQRAEL
jgi:hypothetical protein